jgi:rhodanese-related sulfurtransferase
MDVPEIDVDDLAERREAGQVVLDVRTPGEYEEAHVPGVLFIPMDELVERIDEVPTDGPVPVICATGSRSHQVAEYLRNQGIDAMNVVGGTMAWMNAGFEVESGEAPG